MNINIGISENGRKEIADDLSKLLANSFTLYIKTLNFHWNVTGPMFQPLHLMFEAQYEELSVAVDLIAERIRALGHYAPATYSEFSKLTSIAEPNGIPHFRDMIRQLFEGHEVVIKSMREIFAKAEKVQDQATLDLLASRIRAHEKTAWMLRSTLEG